MNESGPKINARAERIKSLGIHTIEKDGARITYEESYEELDPLQQDEMGIKGIRKKVIIEAPEKFWGNFQEYGGLYYSITEGTFPSFLTSSHAVWGDGGISRGGVAWQKYLEEGAHFQTVEARKGDRDVGMLRKYSDTTKVFNLATLQSVEGIWLDSEDCPVYVFGQKNKALKRYLDKILSDKEMTEELNKAGWLDTPHLKLGPAVGPSTNPPLMDEEMGPSIWAKNWAAHNLPEVHYLLTDTDEKWSDVAYSKFKIKESLHLDNLRCFASGIPIMHAPHECFIPIIEHKDLKPFRWCFADIEMVKNDKGQLEILFFETE